MRQRMKDLMMTAHRGECRAAQACGTEGEIFFDPRGEQQITVTAENMHIYNLGVAAGVHGLLGQLSEDGYDIVDDKGIHVDQADDYGIPQNYDDAFTQWLTPPRDERNDPVDEEEPMD